MKARALSLFVVLFAALARADEIDDLVVASMAKDHVPGVALGIAVNGQLVEKRAYGYANLETMTPVTPSTVFKIASLSKAFCASVAMMLVEEGKMSLEDRVADLLPAFPRQWEAVRVKHLLSHTSGIPDAPGFQFTRQYTDEEFFALYGDAALATEPGATYRYNNFGFATLGMVVGKVSGKPLRDLVRERVFDPLGMSATHYYDMARVVPWRASGYNWRDGLHTNVNAARPNVYDGSGGILTSLEDYAKWDAALRTESPLRDETRQEMWTKFTLNDGTPGTYGFGWFPSEFDGQRVVHHNGSTQGFTAHVIRGLEDGVTVFVFRNAGGDGALELAQGVMKAFRARRKAA